MLKTHTVDNDQSVVFRGDGEPRTTRHFLNQLNEFAANNTLEDDDFSVGGLVEKLEQTIATKLKKPAAIFMPSGTLANHLAIRKHAKTAGRAKPHIQRHRRLDTQAKWHKSSCIGERQSVIFFRRTSTSLPNFQYWSCFKPDISGIYRNSCATATRANCTLARTKRPHQIL